MYTHIGTQTHTHTHTHTLKQTNIRTFGANFCLVPPHRLFCTQFTNPKRMSTAIACSSESNTRESEGGAAVTVQGVGPLESPTDPIGGS